MALAPDEFGAKDEGVIDGAAQRLPAQGGIHAIEVGQEVLPD